MIVKCVSVSMLQASGSMWREAGMTLIGHEILLVQELIAVREVEDLTKSLSTATFWPNGENNEELGF